jgi:general secretion pathway protein G
MRFLAKNTFRQRTLRQPGFTLMELVIVMTVIAILVSVAVPVYVTHVKRAKEVVLMNDLDEMRRALDKYTADKEKGAQSLQELVSGGYLRAIPIDR